MIEITIKAETLPNLWQISLIEKEDLFGKLTYEIVVSRDNKEDTRQVFDSEEVALGIFDGLLEYYTKLK